MKMVLQGFAGIDEYCIQASSGSEIQEKNVECLLSYDCLDTPKLQALWRHQRLLFLNVGGLQCDVCRRSENVMRRLLNGADIGLFTVHYNQLQGYLSSQEPLAYALKGLLDVPITRKSAACILKPWRELQRQICQAMDNGSEEYILNNDNLKSNKLRSTKEH